MTCDLCFVPAARYVRTCFSSQQNGNHLYEMHEDDIIFPANQGDSSMEDEDLQAKEIKEAYGEIEYSEELGGRFSNKRKVHQDDFNSLKFIVET